MIIASFLSAALAAAPPTYAEPAAAPPTVVLPMPFSEIVRGAELIAVATARSSFSRWEDDRRTIRTYVTFGDVTVHKGTLAGGALVLRLAGGTVAEDTIEVAGMPRFERGRRYLLCVAGNGRDLSPIVGFHQGSFEVVDAGGREVLKTRSGHEVVTIRDDRLVLVKPRSKSARRAPELALDDRQKEVLRRAQADAARRARHAERAGATGAAPPRDAMPTFLAPELDPGERLPLVDILQRSHSAGERR
jgi:hypothetical protein